MDIISVQLMNDKKTSNKDKEQYKFTCFLDPHNLSIKKKEDQLHQFHTCNFCYKIKCDTRTRFYPPTLLCTHTINKTHKIRQHLCFFGTDLYLLI